MKVFFISLVWLKIFYCRLQTKILIIFFEYSFEIYKLNPKITSILDPSIPLAHMSAYHTGDK
jgi:hypothetical protein